MRYIILIWILSPLSLLAQYFDYQFENVFSKDQLPSSYINQIIQDKSGVIWISTHVGLSRYDGKEIQSLVEIPFGKDSTLKLGDCDLFALPNGNFLLSNYNNIQGYFEFDPLLFQTKNFPIKDFPYSGISTLNILKDSSILIGSKDEGLFIYDKDLNLLNHLSESEIRILPTGPLVFEKIFEDFSGNCWLSFIQGGLARLIDNGKKIIKYPLLKVDEGVIEGVSDTLNANTVRDFLQVDSQSIWLAVNTGLVEFKVKDETFTHFPLGEVSFEEMYTNRIVCLFEHKGYLWCGTSGQGIFVFDLEKKQFVKNFRHSSHLKHSIASNRIRKFFYSERFEDGVLWIGTHRGISKLDLYQKNFETTYSLKIDGQISSLYDVRTIYSDDQYLWIGSAGLETNSLDIIDKQSGNVQQYQPKPEIPTSIGRGTVGGIAPREDGTYWVTTWEGWLNIFNPKSGTFQKWEGYHNDLGITAWVFCQVVKDRLGNYWFGTIGHGLWKLTSGSSTFTKSYKPTSSNILSEKVLDIFIDPEESPEIFWLGTDNGLSRFNTKTEVFENFLHVDKTSRKKGQPHNHIFNIHKDNKGFIWLALDRGGIMKFDPETKETKRYTKKDGLSSDYAYAIYEDKQGYLWISTLNGISKFDPEKEVFRNYFKEDGLPGNQFAYGAHFKDPDGKIYFGGTYGIVSFYPDQIKDNPFKPSVFFTNLWLQNQKVEIGDTVNNQVVLDQNISQLEQLRLNHKNNDFTIGFQAIHYVNPQQNRYKFKLEGYDQDWRYTDGTNNRVQYANLSPGKYVLTVFAANYDGLWSEKSCDLVISILAPWWQSWWFRVITLAVIIGTGFLYVRIRTYHLKGQKAILEKKVAEKTIELKQTNDKLQIRNNEVIKMAQQLHEQDQAKLNFYTNISHEFRTPLTLIMGPVNYLYRLKRVSPEVIEGQLSIVRRNVSRLLRLTNQLLDISELDAGFMKLSIHEENIIYFVKSLASAFDNKAEKLNLNYQVISNKEAYTCWFDPDKLEKILYNLLSNAFKFTQEKGIIIVRVNISQSKEHVSSYGFNPSMQENKTCLIVQVEDTGLGIPQDQLTKIFDRFYQVNNIKGRKAGTGIGLALTKQLIEKHRGQIMVNSELGKGSVFTFWIPIDKKSFTLEELQQKPITLSEKIEEIQSIDIHIPSNSQNKLAESESEIRDDQPLILLVEDSEDMQAFIRQNLVQSFNIKLAKNGKEGLETALSVIPDIIISDVIMPEMDGMEMCQLLKSDPRTSHIPILFLTAKGGGHSEISGLKLGANDFITKPFNIDILRLKIFNILKSRKELQEKLSSKKKHQRSKKNISPLDAKFMDRLDQNIEENLNDSNLNADLLSKLMGFSYSHLYRKIKALTGQNVSEYIRTYRLIKAAEMLEKQEGNVADIAYRVGFNSPSYFSTMFKKQFGLTPHNYGKE